MFAWFIGSGADTLFKYFFAQRFRNAASLIGNFNHHIVPFVAQIEFNDVIPFPGTQTGFKRVIEKIADNRGKFGAIKPFRESVQLTSGYDRHF